MESEPGNKVKLLWSTELLTLMAGSILKSLFRFQTCKFEYSYVLIDNVEKVFIFISALLILPLPEFPYS